MGSGITRVGSGITRVGSGITAPGSGITSHWIGISSFFWGGRGTTDQAASLWDQETNLKRFGIKVQKFDYKNGISNEHAS